MATAADSFIKSRAVKAIVDDLLPVDGQIDFFTISFLELGKILFKKFKFLSETDFERVVGFF